MAVSKQYGSGSNLVRALDGVTLHIATGRFTAIMGPSGSGKSTLLHCLSGLDRPTSGRVLIGATDVTALNERQLTALRRDRIGFVFQAFNLISTLTVAENLVLPSDLGGRRLDRAWVDHVVEVVGIGDRLGHRPAQLSGGQQQRVAVARALVGRPEIVFADEPTGNLDSQAGQSVLALLRAACQQLGATVVMVTHDPTAAAIADRAVFVADGRIAGELWNPTVDLITAALVRPRSGVAMPSPESTEATGVAPLVVRREGLR